VSYKTLKFESGGGVATITLNRPDAHNVLNADMVRDLMEVSLICADDAAVRAVLLTAEGKAFCAGGDLVSFAQAGEAVSRHITEMTTYLHTACSRFARMDAPMVVAVNGVAAGAGLSLAAMGDFAIAASSAKFTSAYTGAGLTPDGSCTWFLPRLMGLRRAQELIFTNRVLSAKEAQEWNLINRVVDDSDLRDEAVAVATKLADGPTGAFGKVKQLLQYSAIDSLEGQMEREARTIAAAASLPEGQEGIHAFLEKRRPNFRDLQEG